jgi:hypothetical protein
MENATDPVEIWVGLVKSLRSDERSRRALWATQAQAIAQPAMDERIQL